MTCFPSQWGRTRGGMSKIVVGLVEDRVGDFLAFHPLQGLVQLLAIRHRQQHQVGVIPKVLRPLAARVDTGVSDLHDLVGERDVPPHQHVAVLRGVQLGHAVTSAATAATSSTSVYALAGLLL